MIALYIIGGIVFLLFWIGLLRVRIYAGFYEEMSVTVKIGFIKIQLFPAKKGKAKAQKAAAPAKKSTAGEKKKPLTIADAEALIIVICRNLGEIARRICKRVCIAPVELSIITGGDPYDAAKSFGYLNQAVFTGMPLLKSVFHIPDPRIHLDMDFNAEMTKIYGQVGLHLRICDGVAIIMAVLRPVLQWYFQCRKKSAPDMQIQDVAGNIEEAGIA